MPDPLPNGKQWHVFLSYRSVNRPWVLALYDILNGLGYRVFLDQYVLTAAASLATSLGEALEASQGAIMIWSGHYEDSAWCKQELAKLETMQNAGTGFRYVIARIDDSEITGLAATKLWIDFSKQREGPSGSNLLSLLYGLHDEAPLSAAVKLAAEVDEEMKDGLLNVRAARDAGDVETLLALAETNDMAWHGSPMLLCAVAEGLIAMKRTDDALKILDRAQATFPKALRPKQLLGLALARSGQTIKAQLTLGKLYAAGEIDPQTLGILARTWMDRYKAVGEKSFLLKSRDLYRQAFEAFPSDYYTGVNAASKSLLLGEKQTAAQVAERVQKIVGDTPVPGDYWKTATVAEVQLLQGKIEVAANIYRAAVAMAPLEHRSHQSTFEQAMLILDALEASADNKMRIQSAFPVDKAAGTSYS
jgi:hypothetical protein